MKVPLDQNQMAIEYLQYLLTHWIGSMLDDNIYILINKWA